MPNNMFFLRSVLHPRMFIGLCLLISGISAADGVLSRSKREIVSRTCEKKFCVLGMHTACLPRSDKVQEAGVSEEDKIIIVNEHNKYRADIQPLSTNMMKMSWDDEVAKIAQIWAETCQFKHDKSIERTIPGRFSVGQNLAKGHKDWESVLRDWHSEIKDFVFGSSITSGVGHFTQMVWAESVKVGCGFALCDDSPIYVCNYGPAGNIYGKQTFKRGDSCAACPGHCSNNLCDCGGKVCLNGGTMNLETCICECKQAYHVGSQCRLDCSLVDEPSYCGTNSHDWAGCKRYYNVPYTCPVTCRTCPSEIWDDYDCVSGSYSMKMSTNALMIGVISFLILLYVSFL